MSDYVWGRDRCVRAGRISPDEEHPCYFCGVPVNISTAVYCEHCGFYQCPNCGGCYCNTQDEERQALRYLRDKYCCSSEFFKKGIQSEDGYYLRLVPHFIDALNYCRMREGDVKE